MLAITIALGLVSVAYRASGKLQGLAFTGSVTAELPPTRVGPRTWPRLYYGRGCNATQLLAAVKCAKIKEDGASRSEYSALEDRDHFNLTAFEWSYNRGSFFHTQLQIKLTANTAVEGCPPPHLFSPAEACDLISSFGGIRMQGDSLMRQFVQGVLLLLTNSFRELVRDSFSKCRGNDVFVNGRFCKFHEHFDTSQMATVCREQPFVQYDQV